MHRRRSLGFGLLLLLLFVFLAGPMRALPEAPAASEVRAAGALDLLEQAWEWLTSLVSAGESTTPGGEHLSGSEGGGFMDPNGSNS